MKNHFQNIILLAIIFAACSHNRDGEKPIARVYDKYLYASDLHGIIETGVSKNDSVQAVKNYVNDWMLQQLLVSKAEQNVDVDEKELEKKMNDYKESILIYNYENELVRQKLDTVVTEKQLEDFYNLHKDDFVLHSDIARGSYIKIANSDAALVNIKRMFIDPSINQNQMQEVCKKSAQQFSLDENLWWATDIFPAKIQTQISTSKGYIEQHDTAFTYLFQVKEFLQKENISPEIFVKDELLKIILNRRKVEMIKSLRQDIYKEAMQKEEVEMMNN